MALGTSIDVPYPSGIAADDVLVLLVLTKDVSDIQTPDGFTRGDARGQNCASRQWFWTRATGFETGSVAVTKTSGTALLMGRMYRFAGRPRPAPHTRRPRRSRIRQHRGDHTGRHHDLARTGAVVLVAEKSLALGDFTGGTAVVPEEQATTTLGTDGALGVNGVAATSPGLFDFGTYTLATGKAHRVLARAASDRLTSAPASAANSTRLFRLLSCPIP